MIVRPATAVVQIPLDQITVINPRGRSRKKFGQITANIGKLGLKRPITVVRRGTKDGVPQYDLVCGQGRMEALRSLGQAAVPALVIDATQEELLLMSLAENLARRRRVGAELVREIAALRTRGYSFPQIAEKVDLHLTYVKGIARLLKHGERELINAVENGRMPVNVAVTIATADDASVQRALSEAYDEQSLRGNQLMKARQVVERRRAAKRSESGEQAAAETPVSRAQLMDGFRREATKQQALVRKARLNETRLTVIVTALKKLTLDVGFVGLLRAADLAKLPQYLADQVGRPA